MDKNLLNFYNKKAPLLSGAENNKDFFQRYPGLYLKMHIPARVKVSEPNCGDGSLLNALGPASGYGLHYPPPMITPAKKKYPEPKFICPEAEPFNCGGQCGYMVTRGLVNQVWDARQLQEGLSKPSHPINSVFLSVKKQDPIFSGGYKIY